MTLRDRVLAAIEAEEELAKRATPGPWAIDEEFRSPDPGGYWIIGPAETICGRGGWPNRIAESMSNAAFIARSRTLVPALLAEALRQVEEHEPWLDDRQFRGKTPVEVCVACTPSVPMPCPTVRAWAKVFGVTHE